MVHLLRQQMKSACLALHGTHIVAVFGPLVQRFWAIGGSGVLMRSVPMDRAPAPEDTVHHVLGESVFPHDASGLEMPGGGRS